MVPMGQIWSVKMAKKKELENLVSKSIADFKDELKDFEFEILNEDSNDDDDIPYIIPFKNESLQFITGGILGGKFMEISGESQSGKSYLLYQAIASCQEMGGRALLIDIERASTNTILKNCGIKFDGTIAISHERDMTSVFGLMLKFIKAIREKEKEQKVKTITPILIGLDSFPALQIPLAMEEYEKGKEIKGYAAMQKNAKFSQLIEKFVGDLADYGATLVMINQTQIDRTILFGDNIKSKGEDVIKFWCTQRLRGKFVKKLVKEVDSAERKTGTKIQVGVKAEWTGIKNRFTAPFQKAYTYTLFDKGMDRFKGFEENLVTSGRISLGKAKVDKDGNKSRKELTTLILPDGQIFYSVRDLIKEIPDITKPIMVGDVDGGDFSEEDSDSDIDDAQV